MLMGHEVATRWLPGESKPPQRAHISVSVSGISRQGVEETALADTVAVATKAGALKLPVVFVILSCVRSICSAGGAMQRLPIRTLHLR